MFARSSFHTVTAPAPLLQRPMTTPMPAGPAVPDEEASSRLYTALRVLGLVVLVLMLVSIVYSGWIALENWGSIGV